MAELGKLGVTDSFEELLFFTIDHAIDNVGEGETLIPFLITLSQGKRTIHRLITEDMDGAEAMARKIINDGSREVESYAFAYDTLLTISKKTGKEDAIVVDGAERGSETGVLMAQRYEKARDDTPFSTKGNPALIDYPVPRFAGAPSIPNGFTEDE